MKKRLFAILIACVCMLGFTFSPGTFTYVSAPTDVGAAGGDSAESVVTIATAQDLAAKGRDEYFNAAGIVSGADRRVSLKLVADIALTADVTLTADCNLDLGGFTLDLGTNSLVVRHTYAGAFILTNGSVVGEGGTVLLETPNAFWQNNIANFFVNPASVTAESADREAKVAALAKAFATDAVTKGGFVGVYHSDVAIPLNFGSLGDFSYTVPAVASAAMTNTGEVLLSSSDASTDLAFELSATFTPVQGAASSFTIPVRIVGARNAAAWSRLICEALAVRLNAAAVTGLDYDYGATVQQGVYFAIDGYWDGEIGYSTGVEDYLIKTTGSVGKTAYLDVSAIKAAGLTSCDLSVDVGGIVTVYRIEIVSSGVQTDIAAKILRLFFGTDSASTLAFARNSGTGDYTAYPLAYPTADSAKNLELAALGLEEIVKTTFFFNGQGTFTKTGDILTVNPAAADESATAQLEIVMKIGGEEVTRLIDLRYTAAMTDTEANPARFSTHFSYFEQQFRNGTHTKYEMDSSLTLSATKNGAYPYVAYRLADKSGVTYAKKSENGGIDVAFRGSDGEMYTPVYVSTGNDLVFDGFAECAPITDGTGAVVKTRLALSMEKFVKTSTQTYEPVWLLTVDPLKRNIKEGVADEELYLEYQYTFSTDFSKLDVRNWFVYTEVDNPSVKVKSDFVLLSLVMRGANSAQYDFGNTSADDRLYQAIKDEFAPKYTYIPRKYLGETREKLDVKKLIYPDGDMTGGIEQDSVASAPVTNWNWLFYLTGVKTLNLHGMHMTDALVSSHLIRLTHLTGLDVSGVRNSATDYNETNHNKNTPITYDSYTSAITDAGLESLALNLTRLTYLNVAFCNIREFYGLAYLGNSMKTCHLEGNKTGEGSDTRYASLGSFGGYSAVFISGLAARANVYRKIDSAEIAVTDDSIRQVWARCYGFFVQKDWPAGTDLKQNIQPLLPMDIMNDVNSLMIPTMVDGSTVAVGWYSPQDKRMEYEVKTDINEIWLKIYLRSWNLTTKTPVIFIRRLSFTFI